MDSTQIKELIAEAIKEETGVLRDEIEKLKTENKKLQAMVEKLDRDMDDREQYNRKTSLILGGAIPEGVEDESPEETRETALKVIKEKLKVELKGGIAACHRLRNKKRVLIKFQDQDDKDAVYQAKFDQQGEWPDKVTVHENLTEKRAKMITLLEQMRKQKNVLNYHTKNGNILARNTADKRYSIIKPWLTEAEITETLDNAPLKTQNQHTRPKHMTAPNLEPYVTGNMRPCVQTRNQAKKVEENKQN